MVLGSRAGAELSKCLGSFPQSRTVSTHRAGARGRYCLIHNFLHFSENVVCIIKQEIHIYIYICSKKETQGAGVLSEVYRHC